MDAAAFRIGATRTARVLMWLALAMPAMRTMGADAQSLEHAVVPLLPQPEAARGP